VSSPFPSAEGVIGGKYRVLRVLGEGGMGTVLEAEHVQTYKRVAVKWLKTTDRDSQLRLVREAQAAARVRHPNVVDVYDVAQEGDTVFLILECLEGEPLSRLMERGGLPVHEWVALLLPAMRGVAAAHQQGVIHRDIKPDNIFLARVPDAPRPVPKLLDFGISKLEPREHEQLTITSVGTAIGTPMYMSYEQLSGSGEVDARTDVYAFGVVLYEALTGQPPFEAETLSELSIKVATAQPVAPRQLRAEIAEPLERVIMRAMARDRTQRIASMDALIAALEPFASPAPRAPSAKPRWPWALALLVLALAALLSFVRLAHPPAGPAPVAPAPAPAAVAPPASVPASMSASVPASAGGPAAVVSPTAEPPRPQPPEPARSAPRRPRKQQAPTVSPPASKAPAEPAAAAPAPAPAAPKAKFRATSEAPRSEDF
jgi:eukaryotic-like serine/threonine-protein kinase